MLFCSLLLTYALSIATVHCFQRLIVKPSNQTIREGQSLILQCTVGNQAGVGRTWWIKDGVPLARMGDYEVSAYRNLRILGDHQAGEYNLEISNATIEDDATYECQTPSSPNTDGQDALRTIAVVKVLIPPSSVEILSNDPRILFTSVHHLKRTTFRAAKTIDLSCKSFGGRPAPQIRWYKILNSRVIPLTDHSVEFETIVNPTMSPSSEENHKIDVHRTLTSSVGLRFNVSSADNNATLVCRLEHPALSGDQPFSDNLTLDVLFAPGMPQIHGYNGRLLKAKENLKFSCASRNGNPNSTLIWYRNSIEIDRSYTADSQYTINEYEFTVDASDNEAEYKCEVSSLAIVTPLATMIRLKVVYPPDRVVITGPKEGKVGQTVQFTCETSQSNPPASISWNVNGKPFDDLQQLFIRGAISTSTVTFKLNKGIKDVAVVCSAYNEHFSNPNSWVRTSHIMSVHCPPENVTIYGHEWKQPLKVGSSIVLNCLTTGGNPKAEILWYKRDKKVTGSSLTDTAFTEVGSQRSIKLIVDPSDNHAPYRCLVRNSASEASLEAIVRLNVQFPPEKLIVSVSPHRILAGTMVDFTCKSSLANPAPIIEWRRGTELLPSIDVYNTSSKYGGWEVKNRLKILLTAEDHNSKFTCYAKSAVLNYTLHEDVIVAVFYKPVFSISSPQLINVLENESISLFAPAIGNPPVTHYEWSHDRLPLNRLRQKSSDDVMNVSMNSNKAVRIFTMEKEWLNISRAQRGDSGSYACTAFNEQGSSTVTFQVYVSYAAIITYVTTPVLVDPGLLATLECFVDSFPKVDASNVIWQLPYSNPNIRRSFTDGKSRLLIPRVTDNDAGVYICSAFNGIGNKVEAKATLLVRRPAKIVRSDPSRLKSASNVNGDGVMYCEASGVPEVTFVWLRQSDGVNMADEKRAIIKRHQLSPSVYETTLAIKSVREDDYGFYTCVARNDLATDSLAISFNTTSIPDPPYSFQFVNSTSNSICLSWKPGFHGGYPQNFRLLYYRIDRPTQNQSVEIPGSFNLFTVERLPSKTKYAFQIESFTIRGSSGYSKALLAETLGFKTAHLVQHESILVIILISSFGLLLLLLNGFIVFCFIRRYQRRKLLQKAHAVRLSDSSVNGGMDSSRKILMYSSSDERRAAASLNDYGLLAQSNGTSLGYPQHSSLGSRWSSNGVQYSGKIDCDVPTATSTLIKSPLIGPHSSRCNNTCNITGYDGDACEASLLSKIRPDESTVARRSTSVATGSSTRSRNGVGTKNNIRPASGYSEDDRSVHTVIEVDQSGLPLLSSGTFRKSNHTASYLVDSCNSNYPNTDRTISYNTNDGLHRRFPVSSNLYGVYPGFSSNDQKQSLLSNVFDNGCDIRHLPSMADSSFSVEESLIAPPPPAMAPLRSISQELNNAAAFSPIYSQNQRLQSTQSTYAPIVTTGATLRRYSPPSVHSLQRNAYGPLIRPALTSFSSQIASASAPHRSNSLGGAKFDFVDIDESAGDLV